MVNNKSKNLTVQINEKGGEHFRKYTADTLQMLFDSSPTAANFELMILIEGLTFALYRTSCIVRKKEDEYEKYIGNSKNDFHNVIGKVRKLGIIDKRLTKKLHNYRDKRNNITHDLFRLKDFNSTTPEFKNYSYSSELKKLFNLGKKIFVEILDIITPGSPSKEVWMKRFSAQR